MSVLGQILRSLQDSQYGGLDPDRVCVRLVRDCRHWEQHLAGLERQCRQLHQDQEQRRKRLATLQQQIEAQEQVVLAALATETGDQARLLATRVAELEDRHAEEQAALAFGLRQLDYYLDRRRQAERHHQDLCRQLSMAQTSACVQKTLAAIRRHPQVKLFNAKQAVQQIRAREQAREGESCPKAIPPQPVAPHSAEQVLARLCRQRDSRS